MRVEGGKGDGYRGTEGEGLVRQVVAPGEPAAFGPVRGRQDGRDGGVVGGVPVHTAAVMMAAVLGVTPSMHASSPALLVPVLEVMRGSLSARGRAATAAGPPATGASPERYAARSSGRRATA